MLLEECLLVLLRAGGYVPVLSAGSDPTLCDGKAGLECRGRGSVHQLDAVADHRVRLPFINPQRLLLEAKCYQRDKVGLDTVRNAVGVLKDVSEWWVPADRDAETRVRFHYTYAIASGTGFSRAAQKYAYAQDVYLLALKGVRCFATVLDPIRSLSAAVSAQHLKTSRPAEQIAFRERMATGRASRVMESGTQIIQRSGASPVANLLRSATGGPISALGRRERWSSSRAA